MGPRTRKRRGPALGLPVSLLGTLLDQSRLLISTLKCRWNLFNHETLSQARPFSSKLQNGYSAGEKEPAPSAWVLRSQAITPLASIACRN